MMGKLVGGTGLNDSIGVIRRGAGAETELACELETWLALACELETWLALAADRLLACELLAVDRLLACELPVDDWHWLAEQLDRLHPPFLILHPLGPMNGNLRPSLHRTIVYHTR